MANQPIPQLGNLNFQDIKENLTNYLRNQSTFSGYNYEGSAIQTLIDLLAYNTYYYAYYSNIINSESFLDSAQRESSIISLVKPLGYTVPGRTSSRARVVISGLGAATSIQEHAKITSFNENGLQYSFFTLDPIPVIDGSTDEFEIYEGTEVVNFEALPTFNYTSQKVVFVTDEFDLDTLRVSTIEEVNGENQEFIWARMNSVGYQSQVDERIYFVERTTNGFAVVFGSINSLGKAIETNFKNLKIRFLNTSGGAGNGLINFSYSNAIVITRSQSSGGLDNPDMDRVRFLAPKWFAAQERAVTPNDYKAMLIDAGFFANETQFNVFGGQDLSPPRFGRVFLSSNISIDSQTISDMISYLSERSMITVLPEYINANTINIFTDFTFRLGTSQSTKQKQEILTRVKAKFNEINSTVNSFNVSFSATNFSNILTSEVDPNIQITPDDFEIYFEKSLTPNQEYLYNLENEFYLPIFEYVDITDYFDLNNDYLTQMGVTGIPNAYKGVFKLFARTTLSKNYKIDLQLWARDPDSGAQIQIPGNHGYFIATKGVLNIKSGIIDNGKSANLKINFKNKYFSIGLNNLVNFNYKIVTVL